MNKIKQLLDKSWFRILLIIILFSTIIIDIEYPKHRDKNFAEKIKILEETNSSYKYTPFTFIELNKLVNNESIYLGDIDTTYIKDMDSLFKDSNRKDFSGIEKWNVSNVFYMSAMFQNAKYFNEDISSWDTSNVRTMWSMFKGAESFNQDISSWNVSNVENMEYMFSGAASFTQDLSSWNTSNVEEMTNMFDGSPLEDSPPHWYKK